MSKQWRCFHCGEVFRRFHLAAEHFGHEEGAQPACRLKAHEGHLVHYIRSLEDQLARYRAEDSDVLRSIYTLEAEHQRALRQAEEEGYNRGVNDMLDAAKAA